MIDQGLFYVFFLIFVFIASASLGSFGNVIIYRLPQNKSIVNPPSRCIHCGVKLKAKELLPLISYVCLMGKCSGCKEKISPRYFIVELLTGLYVLGAILHFGLSYEFVTVSILGVLLIIIVGIDLEHQRIPNVLVLICLLFGLLFQVTGILNDSWRESLIGFAVGGAFMLLIFIVSKGGMGAGDVKLIAVLGFYVGFPDIIMLVMLSFIIGAIMGIITLILRKGSRKKAIPFAPFIAMGTILTLFWGEQIMKWYLG